MPANSDTTANPAHAGQGTSQKDVPPLSTILLAEAAARRQTFQTEMAINLAIGVIMSKCNQRQVTITPIDLRNFNTNAYVEVVERPDGSFTYTVMDKPS